MRLIPFAKDADALKFMGADGQLTWSKDTCTLRIHDGCCCGGKIVNPKAVSEERIKEIALACIQENDVKVTGYTIVDGVITLEQSDGSTFPVMLPAEVGTYVTEAGTTLDVPGQTLTVGTADDGTEAAGSFEIDLAALFAALTSPAMPTFTGNAVSFDPATNTFNIADTDTDTNTTSTFTDNGDGTYTHNDGNGGKPVTFTAGDLDTDDQEITSNTLDVTSTTDASGQKDYQIEIPCVFESICGSVSRARKVWATELVGATAGDVLPAPDLIVPVTNPNGCLGILEASYMAPTVNVQASGVQPNGSNVYYTNNRHGQFGLKGRDWQDTSAGQQTNQSPTDEWTCQAIGASATESLELKAWFIPSFGGPASDPVPFQAQEQFAPRIKFSLRQAVTFGPS